jgi:hypothetical protein
MARAHKNVLTASALGRKSSRTSVLKGPQIISLIGAPHVTGLPYMYITYAYV